MKKAKSLFIAATRQNDGKTTTSLGLFNAICNRFNSVGYMKPVGQQFYLVDNKKVDKDALLFKNVYDLKDSFSDMSPVAVPGGYTQDFIDNPDLEKNPKKIQKAYKSLTQKNDFVVVEGTGHAGVGSVFNMSNADVAALLGIKVILVSIGGIGSSIDEIMLNKSVFDKAGVELLGVIINKVRHDKYEKVSKYVKKGLERHKIPVFGCIPFTTMLNTPSIESVFEKLSGNLLTSKAGYSNRVEKCLIGDMVPHDALSQLEPNTLLIVPANREGLVMAALCGNLLDSEVVYFVSGIVFTGGKKPHERILNLIKRTHIPVLQIEEDSFTVATKITNMLVKLRSNEPDKIKKTQDLIEEHVDIDGICNLL